MISTTTFPFQTGTAQPVVAFVGSAGSGVTIWAILFWGFLIAALIWLIAWLFLRQYIVDGTDVSPVTIAETGVSYPKDIPPVSAEIPFTDERESPIALLSNDGDRGEDGTVEFADALAGGNARVDVDLGVVYMSAPEQIDDLKLIKGVGKVLEDSLHEFGVYHFKQIAHWRQDVVDEFNDRLAFKGRIERDSWIDQARDLHREKYGSLA